MNARLGFGLCAVVASIALFAVVGAASAGQIFGEKFHEELDPFSKRTSVAPVSTSPGT